MIDSNLGDMGFILSGWVYRTNNLKSRLLCSSPNQSTPISVVLHHYYLNETLMAKLLTPQNKLLIISNISSVSSITTLLCLLLLIKTHKILILVSSNSLMTNWSSNFRNSWSQFSSYNSFENFNFFKE